jgi:diguanylate cyclase (GGDEF)-like protein
MLDQPEPTMPVSRHGEFGLEQPLLDPRAILTSINEVVYDWRVDTDVLSWGANVLDVLRMDAAHKLTTGRSFSRLLDPESLTNRFEAVVNSGQRDRGAGVPYQIQYLVMPDGRQSRQRLWVEDTGRWFAGQDGLAQHAHGVLRVINERHEAEQRLAFLSRFDELTGQMNRSRLAETLSELIENAKRYRASLAFLLAGIDNLATINEAYGFEVADEVIAAVAKRIRARMRGGDGLGRFSGNKFGIVVNRCDIQDMPFAAQRFIDSVGSEVIQTSVGPVSARISIGGVLVPRHARTAGDAMNRAQEALALCKAMRRGGFFSYSPNSTRDATRKANAELTDEIVKALNDRRIVLAYEPIVHADSRQPALYECLVRLRRQDGTLVPAGAIVPISEKLGLMNLIDHRVLELAIEDLASHPAARCTINLSAATATDQEWLSSLALMLHRGCGVADRLTIEITESAAIADIGAMARLVRTMKDYGTRVAIDDFGAGYTSFRALRDLEVDMVKIDGAFVQNMSRSADDRFFVRTLIDLARNLELEIVAEWVQDEETARRLSEWGCHYLQGFYLGGATVATPWNLPSLPVLASA